MSTGLMPALLAFQAEAPTLRKDAVNPHFKSRFTSLDTIVETVGPLLVKHGLVWTTLPGRDEHGDPALHYRLVHAESGEALTGAMPLMLTKQDPQGQGSALTYARRYAVTAVLNLVSDEDDDGTAADDDGTAAQRPQQQAAPAAAGLAQREVDTLLDAIKTAAKGQEWLRATLGAAGVAVPLDGPITVSVLRSLTGEQAAKVLKACGAAADAEVAA